MISSLEDIESDLSVTDTSTITDGIWHLPKCGTADKKSKIFTKNAKTSQPAGMFKAMCLDAVSDLFFVGDRSVAPTVVVDDIDETLEATDFDYDYDSLFTFEFLNTRHFLCRGSSENNCTAPSRITAFSW